MSFRENITYMTHVCRVQFRSGRIPSVCQTASVQRSADGFFSDAFVVMATALRFFCVIFFRRKLLGAFAFERPFE